MRYATWSFKIESRERRVIETLCGENCDLPIYTKSFARVQITNQFATVSPKQTIVVNAKVGTGYNKRETIVPLIVTVAPDELN
jgi:hypothetical protein